MNKHFFKTTRTGNTISLLLLTCAFMCMPHATLALSDTSLSAAVMKESDLAKEEALLLKQDLPLSIDFSLQESVKETLAAYMDQYDASNGLVLISNIHSGEIIASVSLSKKDTQTPHILSKQLYTPVEYGSVFKLFNIAMGLKTKTIQENDFFDVSQDIQIGSVTFDDKKKSLCPIRVPDILINSSNIASVQIAQKAGVQQQKTFFEELGFYDDLSVWGSTKATTQFPQGKWSDLRAANAAIGYGIAASPLHLISAYGALMNGGYYYKPTFLKNGNQNQPVRQVISEDDSRVLQRIFCAMRHQPKKREKKAKLTDKIISYITGSVDLFKNEKDEKAPKRTTFIGSFPILPQYAVYVSLENPKGLKQTYYFNSAEWNVKPLGFEVIEKIAPQLGIDKSYIPVIF